MKRRFPPPQAWFREHGIDPAAARAAIAAPAAIAGGAALGMGLRGSGALRTFRCATHREEARLGFRVSGLGFRVSGLGFRV